MPELIDNQTHEWWKEKSKKWTAGSNPDEALECIKNFNKTDYRVVINSIGPEATDKETIEKSKNNYLILIDMISKNNLNAGITVRLTNLGINYSYDETKKALRTVLNRAKENNILVEIDMEERSVVEKTIKIASEMIDEGYLFRLCIQSGIKDIYDQVVKLKDNISFRIVTGSCYKETLEVDEPETIKQFYRIMLLCGNGSAIGTHITERLLCAKANNMETQVLMAFENEQPKGSVDTIYACFGDWKTNEGIRGYIKRREQI